MSEHRKAKNANIALCVFVYHIPIFRSILSVTDIDAGNGIAGPSSNSGRGCSRFTSNANAFPKGMNPSAFPPVMGK